MNKRTDIIIKRYDYKDEFYILAYYDPDDEQFKAWLGFETIGTLECICCIPKETKDRAAITMDSFLNFVLTNINIEKLAYIHKNPSSFHDDSVSVSYKIPPKSRKQRPKKSAIKIFRYDDNDGFQVYVSYDPEDSYYEYLLGHQDYYPIIFGLGVQKLFDADNWKPEDMDNFLLRIEERLPDDMKKYKEEYFEEP